MKNIFYILIYLNLIFLFLSCNNNRLLSVFSGCFVNKVNEEDCESVKIDMNKVIKDGSFHDVFSKIELIPLQTTDSSIIGMSSRFVMTDDYFIIPDNRIVISVFDREGNFISNSSKRIGQGPEDYGILMGMTYNENTRCIDILTPYYLMSYNTSFQFKGKIKLPTYAATDQRSSYFFQKLFAVEKDKYILLPTTVSKDPHRIILYDSKKEKIVDEISYKKDVISTLTQQEQNINNFDNYSLSFSPYAFSYFLYTINTKDFSMKKRYRLDFENKTVTSNNLKGFKNEEEKVNYLAFESKYPLPLRNFFNQKYIVSIIRCSNEYYTFIKQIETGSDYLVNP